MRVKDVSLICAGPRCDLDSSWNKPTRPGSWRRYVYDPDHNLASYTQELTFASLGIIEVDSVYYWIGENKLNGSAFQSVNCYSSTNLVEWTFVGELLSRESSGDLGPNRIVERPKVIYNAATSKYVMWMHIDSSSYGEAKTGVATGSSVCGKYNYL